MSSKPPNTFGPWLRMMREANGISMTKLARAVSISAPYASLIETGYSHKTPSDDVIERYCVALALDRDEAFARVGKLPPELRPHLRAIIRFWRNTRDDVGQGGR